MFLTYSSKYISYVSKTNSVTKVPDHRRAPCRFC